VELILLKTWGENDRLQDGPAALIDQPQPAYLLAGGQRHLVGGIDLPGVVDLGGTPVGGGGPAGWCGSQASLDQPALKGAGARQWGVGMVPG
jgi:hypothetical protein